MKCWHELHCQHMACIASKWQICLSLFHQVLMAAAMSWCLALLTATISYFLLAETAMSDDAILLKLEEDFTCPITQVCFEIQLVYQQNCSACSCFSEATALVLETAGCCSIYGFGEQHYVTPALCTPAFLQSMQICQ